ncbi:hypothetical protein C8R46DRAFT_1218168 [Mycena filopes]|nr:hypothetical protein C8R46DRAFT_1218168 [Mycena filopes]
MPPLSDSARHYTDLEFQALVDSLSALDVADAVRSSPPPPAYAASLPPPVPRAAAPRFYEFNSPTAGHGLTTEWAEAANLTQGVSSAAVQAVHHRAHHGHKRRRGYAVFYGRVPGATGSMGAEVQVKNVPGSLLQGYATFDEAEAAFAYALQRGWVMVRPQSSYAPQTPLALAALPTPSMTDSVVNPLHGTAASAPQWHVVYAGISPGVYGSYLECALNTIGLSSASYESTPSRREAEERWQKALADGHILTISQELRLRTPSSAMAKFLRFRPPVKDAFGLPPPPSNAHTCAPRPCRQAPTSDPLDHHHIDRWLSTCHGASAIPTASGRRLVSACGSAVVTTPPPLENFTPAELRALSSKELRASRTFAGFRDYIREFMFWVVVDKNSPEDIAAYNRFMSNNSPSPDLALTWKKKIMPEIEFSLNVEASNSVTSDNRRTRHIV